MIIFRPHGLGMTLSQSMAHAKEFKNEERMKEYIVQLWHDNLAIPGTLFTVDDIVIDKSNCSLDEDSLMMLAIDAGAEDFSSEEEVYEVTSNPEIFSEVREKLEAEGLEFLEAGVQMVPSTYVALDDAGSSKMERLIEMLEDLDDVSEIYHNWEE